MPTYDVAVVGLGAMGSAALYHLAARGHRVIGLDRHPLGHTHGSSHGESRIIRLAYCEHPDYVPLLRLAYRNWRDLEAATGQGLLLTTGMIEAGPPGAAIVAGSVRAALEHDLPHELLSAAEIGARFPALTLPGHWTGIFQPEAGILAPERIIALHVAAAEAKGAEVRDGAAVAGRAGRVAGMRDGGHRAVADPAGDRAARVSGRACIMAGAAKKERPAARNKIKSGTG